MLALRDTSRVKYRHASDVIALGEYILRFARELVRHSSRDAGRSPFDSHAARGAASRAYYLVSPAIE